MKPTKRATVGEFKREPLTSADAERLAVSCSDVRERLFVWTLLDTGVRVSELAGLTRGAIDWNGHRFTVKGKGGRKRVVPMSARVRPLLESWFALHETMRAGPRTIQYAVRRVAARAMLTRPVTPHVLRHTFAVLCLQRGLSLPALQKLLGHSHLVTTAIYLRLSPEEALREYRERF